MRKIKIIIWGIGRRTERYLKFAYFKTCDIIGFVDTYFPKTCYLSYSVYRPDELIEIIDDIDYLIISTQFFSEIYSKCLEMSIDRKKIILTDYVDESVMMQNMNVVRHISHQLYEDIRMRMLKFTSMNEKDDFDLIRLVGRGKYSTPDYTSDYYRYRTFEFVANEIIEHNVMGSVAELGVFRGTFASLINEKFADRTFYLFDTFTGFDENESESEKVRGHSNDEFVEVHKQTSLEIVLSHLPYKERCYIYKGFFPDIVTEEIRQLDFAFVSIDVDFEESIYEGIKFFYERLTQNGVIFIHDYNSQYLHGVKNAVERYERDFDLRLKKVPLADRAGTLVIIK